MFIIGKRREKYFEYLINYLLWIDLFKWGLSFLINIMFLFVLYCIFSNEIVLFVIGNLMVYLNFRWIFILYYFVVMNGYF